MKNLVKITLLLLASITVSDAYCQKGLPDLDRPNVLDKKPQVVNTTPIQPQPSFGTAQETKIAVNRTNGSIYVKTEKQALTTSYVQENLSEIIGLDDDNTFILIRSYVDELGQGHQSYQHFYAGVKVDGSNLLVHSIDNTVNLINGQLIEMKNVEIDSEITSDNALKNAKSHLGVKTLIQEYPIELVLIKIAKAAYLAYKIRVDSYTPFEMCNVYVDAKTGDVIKKVNLNAHADVTGSGKTFYSGNQSFKCDSYSGNYRLRESSRNIQTYNATNETGLTTNGYTGSTDFISSSTTWSGVPQLNSFTISNVSQSWWYTAFADEKPDLYIKVIDGNDVIVYTSNYYSDAFPTITWKNLGILLTDPTYTIEVWDYDPIGSDDFGGSYKISTSTGTYTWSGNGNSGSYNVTDAGNLALDVHWGMEVCYDFYLNELSRKSFDGNGGVIKNYINPRELQSQYGNSPNNAFAISSPYNIMAYGLGDGQSMYPLVSLDVEGHEFTHLVIDNNGNGGLEYSGESGALNESFADIFGACMEFYSGVDPDWYIGEDIMVSDPYLRSMSNPNGGDQPDTYEGDYWVNPSSSQDYGGVHTNSGVQNFWFYLLSEGGSGTNDLGNPYSVTKIGLNDARDIAYRNLTTYLTSKATMLDAYYGSLQAAEDLYGNPSTQFTAVLEAWYAVGIGTNPNSYCDGVVRLTSPSGNISDGSGSADYNNNSNCTWVIAPPGATSISLNFTSFDTEAGYDTVYVYDGPDDSYQILAYWWGNTLPQTITTSSGVGAMCIKFVSDDLVTGDGWNAAYSSTGSRPSCEGGTVLSEPSGSFTDGSGGFDYGNNQLCYWYISPPCAETVTLKFTDFDTESGYDGLVIYDDWDGTNILDVLSGTSLPDSVTSTTGMMLVAFESDFSTTMGGFQANYTSTGSSYCTGVSVINNSDWGIISDGSGADNYCNNSSCEWLIEPPSATSVTLDFTEFDLEEPSIDGTTIYDAVEVYDGSTDNGTLLGRFSGSSIPPSITASSGKMFIRFYSDLLENGQGWKAKYTSTQELSCTGQTTLTSVSGTFDDGSGNFKYANNSECSWLISPPNATSITLSFSEFDTEESRDGVIIYDGANDSAQILAQYSGTSIPNSVTSSGGEMYVKFITDPEQRENGFKASYTSQTVGINEMKYHQYFKIFPNPATNIVTIRLLNGNNADIALMDPTGKQVIDKYHMIGNEGVLDIRLLRDGIYFLRIETSEFVSVHKMVIESN